MKKSSGKKVNLNMWILENHSGSLKKSSKKVASKEKDPKNSKI